jgi:hypothetical protein
VVRSVVKDGAKKEANELTEVLHYYRVQEYLLLDENQDLRECLAIRKKRNKHGKKLDMRKECEYYGVQSGGPPEAPSTLVKDRLKDSREKRRKTSGKQT